MLLRPNVDVADVETPSPRVKKISGRVLAKWLRKGTIDVVHLARLALQLQRGEVVIGNLTAKQARQITGIDVTVLAAMRRIAPPAPRLRKARNRVTYRRELSDNDLDQLIDEAGHGRVLAALDRVTRPVVINGGSGSVTRSSQADTLTSVER
jgi:hypothetical protein